VSKNLAIKASAFLLTSIGLLAPAAGAQASSTLSGRSASAQVDGCVGSSFAATLGNQKAICSGNFLVRMQGNGDLVLRVISTGRACWTSGTAGAWSNDAYAEFKGNIIGKPYVDIYKSSQGKLKRVVGAHTATTFGTNANVNTRGEFWIGYKKVASC
jgi:hypothetical protein